MATFGTFVSGQVLTAAELNSAGEWQSYTPTWTQSATITKTVNWARYTQLNKLVIVSIKMTATGAGTANNVIKVGLPVNASTNNFMMGTVIFQDESATPDTFRPGFAVFDAAATVSFMSTVTSSGDATLRMGQTSGNGLDIASGDVAYVQLTYEAA